MIPTSPVDKPASDDAGVKVNLYKRREKIFVHYVGGFYQRLRTYFGWPLLLGYFLLPWLTWNERQAVLFDLPARKFYIFGITLWPQDFMLLAWLLIIAAFSLFLVTSLVGRLWCGYTCPQTVWTAIFLWVEKLTEGSSSKRRRLDKQRMNKNKFMRKTIKHGLWLGFSALTGFTFVAYFTPAAQLAVDLSRFSASFWAIAWVVFFTLATYINAGWLREQVCIYMCPYARFQSAMIDHDTLIVTYDAPRGEPRGSRKRADSSADLGDCVDCKLCVQVCPTGIDIRDGLQIECIQCAHCIDACNEVMGKMEYPVGLIRYDSERNIQGKGDTNLRFIRGRTIGYGLVLAIMLIAFFWKLTTRMPFTMEVLRDRGTLYHLEQASVRNDYTIKIANKSESAKSFELLATKGDESLRTDSGGSIEVEAGEVISTSVSVFIEQDSIASSITNISINLCQVDIPICAAQETRFIGPQ